MTARDDTLLRRTLQANGCFSLISGGLILSYASPLAAWMGIPDPLWIWALGPGLLVFGALVLGLGLAQVIPPSRARLVVWLDWGWVAGSALVMALFAGSLATPGIWLIADVALVVAVFAALQQIGVRRVISDGEPVHG